MNDYNNLYRMRLKRLYGGIIDYCDDEINDFSMCKEWFDDFENFYDWSMKNGYSNNKILVRLNDSGDFCPKNCQWISRQEFTARQIKNC